MPAMLRGRDLFGDLIGMKWVAGFAGNPEIGLPAISALVILNDPATGIPVAIMDGGPITAQRTAAVSGIALRRYGPLVEGRPVRATMIGAGVQGFSHLPVLGHVLPGVELHLFDRDPARTETLACGGAFNGDDRLRRRHTRPHATRSRVRMSSSRPRRSGHPPSASG